MATSSTMVKFTANEAKAADALASGIAAVFRKIAPIDAKAVLFGYDVAAEDVLPNIEPTGKLLDDRHMVQLK